MPDALTPEQRRLRRELLRRHHPDLGGDPEQFIQVLEAFQPGRVGPESATTSVSCAGPAGWRASRPGTRRAAAVDPAHAAWCERPPPVRINSSEVVMPPTVVGLFTGLLLGLAWVIGGFDAFVGTAVLGVIGFLVGKVVSGQLDLTPYLGGGR